MYKIKSLNETTLLCCFSFTGHMPMERLKLLDWTENISFCFNFNSSLGTLLGGICPRENTQCRQGWVRNIPSASCSIFQQLGAPKTLQPAGNHWGWKRSSSQSQISRQTAINTFPTTHSCCGPRLAPAATEGGTHSAPALLTQELLSCTARDEQAAPSPCSSAQWSPAEMKHLHK